MNRAQYLKKFLYSSGFLASVPAILVILLFLPSLGSKYNLLVESVDKGGSRDLYADLNGDNISEVIRPGKGVPYYFALIMDNDYHFYDQWNLKDNIDPDLSDFFIGDFDNDLFKEIYIFTYSNDSLFLNLNEFFQPGGALIERRYITKIGYINNKVTSSVYPAGFFDENGDGKKELYFSIATGFGLEPRRAYYYDIVNGVLKSSEFTGMMCLGAKLADADGDAKPELFGFMSASGNYDVKTPFPDKSTWLMVFDDKLDFEFPPVGFRGFTNSLETNAFSSGNFKGYLLAHYTASVDTSVLKPGIMKFSIKGDLIMYHPFSYYGLTQDPRLVVINHNLSDRIYLLGNVFLELDDKLKVVKKVKSPFSSDFLCYKADIDFNGQEDLLVYSEKEEKLVVYNEELIKECEVKIKARKELIKFTHYRSAAGEDKLFMNSPENGYLLKLEKNNLYYLGYLAYPGIYLLFFLFIILIKKINTFQVVEKESLKQRLLTLQLQGIKAQLDPHFTFNTLNSVASLIYLEERQSAYDYMNKFTQLLRAMLKDTELIYRSVGEEVEFVTTYLELEKLRFGDKFNFEIEIGEGVSQKEQIPKLVLHTFAENAMKHGIIPSASRGLLKISIDRENDNLKLTIEDNGIGREAASGHSDSMGKGLKITGEFFDILNHINKKPIKHLITDLHSDSGIPAGTRVEVWVPVEEEEQDKRQNHALILEEKKGKKTEA
jgi:two-component sensor histidine kinase